MAAAFITPEELLKHWQSHRGLTRRMIEAYPEEQLFTFSVGGMRSFGSLVLEMIAMAEPMVRGVVERDWTQTAPVEVVSKEDLLRQWDESTRKIDELWPRIPPESFHETITAFGQYTGATYSLILYVVENEIHHRGQGYVYMRALGVEPPPFWDRTW
jgi:uncharacterized damage-inducible protein DinB